MHGAADDVADGDGDKCDGPEQNALDGYLIVVCSFQRTKLSAKTSNHIFNMIHAKYIVIPF